MNNTLCNIIVCNKGTSERHFNLCKSVAEEILINNPTAKIEIEKWISVGGPENPRNDGWDHTRGTFIQPDLLVDNKLAIEIERINVGTKLIERIEKHKKLGLKSKIIFVLSLPKELTEISEFRVDNIHTHGKEGPNRDMSQFLTDSSPCRVN